MIAKALLTRTSLLAIALVVLFALPLVAQGPPEKLACTDGERYDKIKALKVAYITTKLELTTDEAQIFWPLYNEYQQKRVEMKQQEGAIYGHGLKEVEDMTEVELTELLNNYIVLEEDEVALEKSYINKFKTLLPVRKVALLLRAEHEFKKEVLRELQKREPNKP